MSEISEDRTLLVNDHVDWGDTLPDDPAAPAAVLWVSLPCDCAAPPGGIMKHLPLVQSSAAILEKVESFPSPGVLFDSPVSRYLDWRHRDTTDSSGRRLHRCGAANYSAPSELCDASRIHVGDSPQTLRVNKESKDSIAGFGQKHKSLNVRGMWHSGHKSSQISNEKDEDEQPERFILGDFNIMYSAFEPNVLGKQALRSDWELDNDIDASEACGGYFSSPAKVGPNQELLRGNVSSECQKIMARYTKDSPSSYHGPNSCKKKNNSHRKRSERKKSTPPVVDECFVPPDTSRPFARSGRGGWTITETLGIVKGGDTIQSRLPETTSDNIVSFPTYNSHMNLERKFNNLAYGLSDSDESLAVMTHPRKNVSLPQNSDAEYSHRRFNPSVGFGRVPISSDSSPSSKYKCKTAIGDPSVKPVSSASENICSEANSIWKSSDDIPGCSNAGNDADIWKIENYSSPCSHATRIFPTDTRIVSERKNKKSTRISSSNKLKSPAMSEKLAAKHEHQISSRESPARDYEALSFQIAERDTNLLLNANNEFCETKIRSSIDSTDWAFLNDIDSSNSYAQSQWLVPAACKKNCCVARMMPHCAGLKVAHNGAYSHESCTNKQLGYNMTRSACNLLDGYDNCCSESRQSIPGHIVVRDYPLKTSEQAGILFEDTMWSSRRDTSSLSTLDSLSSLSDGELHWSEPINCETRPIFPDVSNSCLPPGDASLPPGVTSSSYFRSSASNRTREEHEKRDRTEAAWSAWPGVDDEDSSVSSSLSSAERHGSGSTTHSKDRLTQQGKTSYCTMYLE